MENSKKNSLIQLICFVVLAFGIRLSSANPEEISPESGLPTPLYRSMGQPLTDIERMELHQRRFIDAANGVAKLFSQFDQKIREITQAAKAVSESPYNERVQQQLLYKARQMENTQNSFDNKYLQLHAKMQYEFSNFVAASNDFMTHQDKIKIKN
jgi:hypothetical protein